MRTAGPFGAAEAETVAAIRTSVLSIAALAGPLAAASLFVLADMFSLCHSRPGVLTQARVGHNETWRSSMMSSAARDPYWRARVRGGECVTASFFTDSGPRMPLFLATRFVGCIGATAVP